MPTERSKMRSPATSPASTVSPIDRSGWPSVVLCIPTCRRPEGLRKLLSHVALLGYRGRLSAVVVENDPQLRSGAEVTQRLACDFPFPLAVMVEQRRGQTYA